MGYSAITRKHSLMWASLTPSPKPICSWYIYWTATICFKGCWTKELYHFTLQGNQAPSKKNAQEIPTPQFDAVDTYERDYTRTFAQPTSYIRGRGGFFLVTSLGMHSFLVKLTLLCLLGLLLRVINICSQSWDRWICWVWPGQWRWGLAWRIQ